MVTDHQPKETIMPTQPIPAVAAPLTMRDIGERYGRTYAHLRTMRSQGKLPEPAFTVNGVAVWDAAEIDRWATGVGWSRRGAR